VVTQRDDLSRRRHVGGIAHVSHPLHSCLTRCLQHFRRYSRWSRSLVVLDVDDGLPHILYRDLFSWSLHCAAYSEANQNRKKVRRKIVKDVGAVVKCQHQKNVSFMKRGSTDVIYVSNVSGKSESTSVQNYQRNNRRPTTFSV